MRVREMVTMVTHRGARRLAMIFLAGLLAHAGAYGQDETPVEATWVTNGSVEAIAQTPSTLYIGGAFTYVGPFTGMGVPLDRSSAAAVTPYPKVSGGSVWTAVPDGSGGWFIGGDFRYVGGVARNRIAHILSDGSVDPSWDPNASSTVFTLLVDGSTVYAGGTFSTIGGQSRRRLAALDAATGLAGAWDPNANSSVYALALSDDGQTMYAGGWFTNIGGQTRNYIAAINVSTGAATTWNPGANSRVIKLIPSGNTIYACGQFTSAGGQSRGYIAAINATTGNATSWNPNANGIINDMAMYGSTIYVGGSFTGIGGAGRTRIAAVDVSTGSATSWNPSSDATVYAIGLSPNGQTIYAGGDFDTIGGSPVIVSRPFVHRTVSHDPGIHQRHTGPTRSPYPVRRCMWGGSSPASAGTRAIALPRLIPLRAPPQAGIPTLKTRSVR